MSIYNSFRLVWRPGAPQLVERVHIYRKGVHLAVRHCLWRVYVVVEFGESMSEFPHRFIGGVKDVRPVLVDVDAFDLAGVAVSADV